MYAFVHGNFRLFNRRQGLPACSNWSDFSEGATLCRECKVNYNARNPHFSQNFKMQIIAFRVKSFRSIVDSSWVRFSSDGVTAFVGQNESGKSTILHALHFALSRANPSDDDFRIESSLPSVDLRVKLTFAEIADHLKEASPTLLGVVDKFVVSQDGVVEIRVGWEPMNAAVPIVYRKKLSLLTPELDKQLSPFASIENAASAIAEALQSADPRIKQQRSEGKSRGPTPLTSSKFAQAIWDELPLGVLFRESDGELPNHVDINKDGEPTGIGAEAAANFLKIAKIDLPNLLSKERRALEASLRAANARVTEDFAKFWTQTVGKNGRLSIKIDIDHYNQKNPEKIGQPYLVFWVIDGATQLYPRQRSQGVRWFVSFYLQLKSSEVDGLERMFLLDEPGANLHSRAQKDVLRLINQLSLSNSTVVYTTHSPELIEYSKLFRVHAVQRNGESEDSPTTIIDAHRLGTASTDTLSPVLAAMGANLSHQQVIKKTNNVLLEEMSGYYYLSAFWSLTRQEKKAYFIAATGVNKIEGLANMFRGWGLEFIVAIDDDKQGREAYASIKRQLFGNEDVLAAQRLIRMPNCSAIEDAFSAADFAKFVLNDESISFTTTVGEYLKNSGRSKPVLAFNFALRVSQGAISLEDFDGRTKQLINGITTAIASRLGED